MARTRLINPAAPLDEDVARLSMAARLLWAYLPCHADRDGRMKDSAFSIKASVFPSDDVDVNALLSELADAGHVVRYSVSGKRYIQIRNFAKYQSPHKNEASSSIPPVPVAIPHESSSNYTSPRSHPVSDPDPVIDPVSEISPSACDPTAAEQVAASRAAIPEAIASMAEDEHGVLYGPPIKTPPERRRVHFAAKTPAFKAVYDRYPRKDAEARAAQEFQEIAAGYPGGESELSLAILAAFDAGMLKRHPYTGPNDKRPYLETVLAERRWEDAASAPDDPPPPKASGPTRYEAQKYLPLTPRKIPASNP